MIWGRFRINDFHNYGAQLSTHGCAGQILEHRDGAYRADDRGRAPAGFHARSGFSCAHHDRDGRSADGGTADPAELSEISMMTISYGHGLSVSPLHLASAYAAMVNGGIFRQPTLLRQDGAGRGDTGDQRGGVGRIRSMLRQVVSRGTATMADVEGYEVGGRPARPTSRAAPAAITMTRSSRPLPACSRRRTRNM